MRSRSVVVRRLVPILLLAAIGIASGAYLLVQQRFPVPFRETYEIRAVLPAADGVAPGFGQAVNVAGVRVGSITKAVIRDRKAYVTLEIDRHKLPRVYDDARADLRPVTPLSDMRIELEPGTPGRRVMADNGLIPPSRTTSPVPLPTLLNALDGDTRSFLVTLLDGAGAGTRGRAPDIRKVLLSFGPAAGELRRVSERLAARRTQLKRLVTNLSAVADAADARGELASLIVSGNTTLEALRRQDEPLRLALARLPGALGTADEALRTTGALADDLRPSLTALRGPIRDLPATLRQLEPAANGFERTVKRQFLPFTTESQPLLRQLEPTLRSVSQTLPDATGTLGRANVLLNGLTYNPPGPQEGGLFWFFWQGHNFNSATTQGDAHGNNVRALVSVSCNQLTTTDGSLSAVFKLLTGAASVCPGLVNEPAVRGGTRGRTGGDADTARSAAAARGGN